MEVFGSGQKTRGRQAIYSVKEELNEAPFSVNFFLEAPYFESITLQEFETYAAERLKVLRVFENAGFKTTKGSPEYNDFVLNNLPKELRYRYVRPQTGTPVEEVLQHKRLDVLSHFILRMVFSRSEDQRRWFIQQEVDLFRYRLSGEEGVAVVCFLKKNGFDFNSLPEEEFRNISPILAKSTFIKHGSNSFDSEFYKLDFQEALNFVKKRHVFLSMGFAFVPRRFLVDVVNDRFRENLSGELTKLSKVILESGEDTRLVPVLARLAVGYTGKDYSSGDVDFNINLDNLDQLSAESFPLCSRNIYEHLRKEHHLKHDARLQFGLFLKGIGLSMEDSLKLFRQEFSRHGMTEKAFNSQHKYNIRHMYGQEGRRINYTPFSCMKIILGKGPLGPSEHHGCPFKHFSSTLLEQRMKSYGISSQDAESVKDLTKHGHFQVACTKYFELTHKKKLLTAIDQIQHPNQYFEESRRLLHPETVKDRPSMFKRTRPPATFIKTETEGGASTEMDSEFPLDEEMEAFLREAEMEIDSSA